MTDHIEQRHRFAIGDIATRRRIVGQIRRRRNDAIRDASRYADLVRGREPSPTRQFHERLYWAAVDRRNVYNVQLAWMADFDPSIK